MATGFVIERKDSSSPGGVTPVVVTSLHVLKTIGSNPLVIGTRIPTEEGEPQIAVIRIRPRRSSGPFYVRHPTEDIGAFELKVPTEAAGVVRTPSFLREDAVRLGSARLHAGDEVSFLGFPDVIPLTSDVFPILRTGRIASYPTAASHSKHKLIINADVYPGDSGAPVFTSGRGGRPKLVGMIVQRIGRDPRTFAHFAIAVDAAAIRETLELLSKREVRAIVENQ